MQAVFANAPPTPPPLPLTENWIVQMLAIKNATPQCPNSSSRADLPNPCRQHMPQSCFIYFCSRFSKVVWCLFQKPHFSIHLQQCHAGCICKCPPHTPTPPPYRKLNCADASHQECSPPMPNSSSRADLPNPCRQHMPQSCFIYFCIRFSKVVWCLFQKPCVLIHLL